MNSLERVKTVLRGEIPDRVPVCLHNFMMAAREAGIPMEEYRRNPEAISRAHLTAVEKYRYDCLLIDTDTTMLAEAMGATSECAHNEPGRIVAPAIARLEEVEKLRVIDPERDGRVPAILEGVRLMARQVGSEIAIRGNADQAAFDLACMVRGTEEFLMDLATDAVKAKRTAGAHHVLFGNVDPSAVIAQGTTGQVREKTRELMSIWKPGGHFVLNAGCAIPAHTPSENIRAFIETAHREGVYD